MKFLFLSGHAHLALDPNSERASGGAELQVALLSQELLARGHRAIIVAADPGSTRETTFKGIRILPGGRFETGRPLDTLRALPRVARVLRRE
ncbi:MAG TPA: hypothetical protein VFS35_06665, partial [Terrimicrobiaceae bacterium]|nr:hypothetical protein [Terrimicrobiaceae bacterium]